jgi:iron complex outermembrane receptor protein
MKRCLGVSAVVSLLLATPVWADPVLVGQATSVHSPVTVTGLKVSTDPTGILMIQVRTTEGQTPQFFTSGTGQILVIDLLGAQLQGNTFSQERPLSGIESVTLSRRSETSLRLTILGTGPLPDAQIESQEAGLLITMKDSVTEPKKPASDAVASAPTPEPTEPPPSVATPNPTSPETPDLELEEITVLGERIESYSRSNATTATRTDTPLRDIPQSIQVVPQSVLRDQQVGTVSEALRNVSGVQVDDNFGGTIDRLNIRGFQADVFLENGFRRGAFGGRGLSDPELIESIEVLKGPASVLYGNIEPGGVVNVVTERPLEFDFREFSLTTSTSGSVTPSFDLSGPLGDDGNVFYRLNGLVEYNDGWRDYDQDVQRLVIAPAVTWQISDRTTLDLQIYYSDDERPFDRGIPAIGEGIPDIPFDRRFQNDRTIATTEELSLGYQLSHQFKENWTLNHDFRFLAVDTFDFRIDNWIIEDSGQLDRRWRSNDDYLENYAANLNIVGEFNTGPISHTLLTGVDWNQDIGGGKQRRLPGDPSFFIDIFTLEGDPIEQPPLADLTNVVRDNLDIESLVGLYIQDQISFTDNLKMLAGGRLDFFDLKSIFNGDGSQVDATEFSPRIGVVYQPTQEISLYASFSEAFTPNIFDLTADGEPIEPEVSQQIEVGIRGEFLDGNLIANLAVYDLTKENVAATDPDNPDFAIPVGEISSEGIEFDLAGEILPGWNLIASYAYTDAAVTQDTSFIPAGNRPDNVAENTASFWTTYRFQEGALEGFGFGIGVFSVGERFGDFENTFRLPSYVQTDAALFYRSDNWQASLNFKNLFDEDYIRYSEGFREANTPGDPFTVVGSFNMQF